MWEQVLIESGVFEPFVAETTHGDVDVHEMAIAEDLLRQVLAAAAQNQVRRVLSVELELGVQRLIVPEALEAAFEALAEGSVAQGAVLRMVEVPLEARCGGCGAQFAPSIDDYACPRCGEAMAELLAGNDIILRSLDAETD